MKNKSLKNSKLSQKILCSILAAGVLGMSGSVFAKEVMQEPNRQTSGNYEIQYANEVKESDKIFTTGEVKTTNGYNRIFWNDVNLTNCDFTNNINISNGPASAGLYTYNSTKQLVANVTGGKFENNGVKNNDAVNSYKVGSSANGGAIFVKGTKLNLTDVAINNNYADGNGYIAAGGAIFLDATSSGGFFAPTEANIKITKDTVYENNVVQNAEEGYYVNSYGALMQSGGGFMYLDRTSSANFDVAEGATLTIGGAKALADKTGYIDGIASSIPLKENEKVKHAVLTKNGEGTLVLNGSLNKYYGTLNVEAGTLQINNDWNIKNAVSVNGGTLDLTNSMVTLESFGGEIDAIGTNGSPEKKTVDTIHGSITTAAGSTLNAGNVVMKEGTSIDAAGEVNISKGLEVDGGATAVLNGGGDIDGFIKIDNGTVSKTGGTITATGVYEKEDGLYLQEDIRVNGSEDGEDTNVQSKLTLDGVEVTGNIMAEHKGSEITIKNSTINEGEFYQADKVDGRYQLVLDENGQPVVDGYTELQAEIGGKVTVENSVLNTSLSAYGEGSEMTVTNSSVTTKGGVLAAEGGKISFNGNADTVYEVAKDGYFIAASTNEEDDGTKIEINGGTLKAENLRYVVGLENNPILEGSYQGDPLELKVVKGGIVLQNNGIIETKGDQIFAKGVDVTSDETVIASESGAVTNEAISYVGGTLNLTDEKYSLGYVQSAKDNLKDYQKDSTTSIVMTGTLVSADGEENEITVDDAASVGSDVALDKVTVNADKNLIVGVATAPTGDVAGINVEDAVNNGFNAGSLNLAEGSTGMVITDGQNVTLGGSNGGDIITVDGAATDGVKVVVGTTSKVGDADFTSGSFTIGNALATSDTKYTLTGSVTVNENSTLNVNGTTNITGGVTLDSGDVNVGNGTLVSDVTAKGNVTLTGNADIGKLSVDSENGATTVINVGTADATASTSISNADLNGATICFDPDWNQAAGTHAITFTSNIDGEVLVVRNNYVGIGTEDNNAAKAMFEKSGLTFGENNITAALYIAGNQTLENSKGAIFVDGSKDGSGSFGTVDAGSFTAAANSVVMVDGQSIKDSAALSGVSSATIDEASKLYVDGAKKGETYKVLAGENIDAGWVNENIISDNALLIFTGDNSGNTKFDVTASYDKVNNVYGENAVVIDSVVDKTLEVKNEGDKAFDFFNDAVNSHNNATKAQQVEALNSVANMGELAGVNHGTYSMSNAMTDAVAHHLSLATHGEQDKDIWAHYIHNKEDVDGMDLGGISGSYEAQYNGIVIGSDLYKNGKTTAGIALSYADGNINGSNSASSTKNDAEYYGASLYGRIDNGNSAILGDISYMHSDNDITQHNSGNEITASADADAFSIGIRAEQAYEAGAGKFVPYAGIRYMHLGAGNYTNSLGMEYDADDQNLWLLPVGVTYSAEVQSGDWTIKPVAEVGYVWTMGDRDTDQTVSLNGAADTFGFETADSGSFIGRLGIEAEKANITYGLGYEYQKGDTVKANKWMANLTFSF